MPDLRHQLVEANLEARHWRALFTNTKSELDAAEEEVAALRAFLSLRYQGDRTLLELYDKHRALHGEPP